ncbi:hypothetical protein B0H16DRAFT_1446441 [Mycena metata]|uniref:Protein kinase domain-containing protein n=1 Tax=Mycena metata TaxID=1033252 RepID=A0AAD7P1X3_9AGAR|nr:hypothetical protein B0H16DRAFT_1446441 [Mycena metata]
MYPPPPKVTVLAEEGVLLLVVALDADEDTQQWRSPLARISPVWRPLLNPKTKMMSVSGGGSSARAVAAAAYGNSTRTRAACCGGNGNPEVEDLARISGTLGYPGGPLAEKYYEVADEVVLEYDVDGGEARSYEGWCWVLGVRAWSVHPLLLELGYPPPSGGRVFTPLVFVLRWAKPKSDGESTASHPHRIPSSLFTALPPLRLGLTLTAPTVHLVTLTPAPVVGLVAYAAVIERARRCVEPAFGWRSSAADEACGEGYVQSTGQRADSAHSNQPPPHPPKYEAARRQLSHHPTSSLAPLPAPSSLPTPAHKRAKETRSRARIDESVEAALRKGRTDNNTTAKFALNRVDLREWDVRDGGRGPKRRWYRWRWRGCCYNLLLRVRSSTSDPYQPGRTLDIYLTSEASSSTRQDPFSLRDGEIQHELSANWHYGFTPLKVSIIQVFRPFTSAVVLLAEALNAPAQFESLPKHHACSERRKSRVPSAREFAKSSGPAVGIQFPRMHYARKFEHLELDDDAPVPEWGGWELELYIWTTKLASYFAEALAYRHLRALQGHCIPALHGTVRVPMASSSELLHPVVGFVPGLALEYIDGPNMEQIKIREACCWYNDLRLPNVILRGWPNDPQPVIIDFGVADVIEPGDSKKDWGVNVDEVADVRKVLTDPEHGDWHVASPYPLPVYEYIAVNSGYAEANRSIEEIPEDVQNVQFERVPGSEAPGARERMLLWRVRPGVGTQDGYLWRRFVDW